jgi:hypothetical protein
MTTIYGSDIYVGFVHIQNLEIKLAEQIVAERERNGPYKPSRFCIAYCYWSRADNDTYPSRCSQIVKYSIFHHAFERLAKSVI